MLDLVPELLSCASMSKKDKLDFAGVIMLVGFALLLAFNQVETEVIKYD